MKKYLALMLLLISLSGYGQKLSQQFDAKTFAEQQTAMIKSALDLDQATTDKVYKANLFKAYAVYKRILLAEQTGEAQGKSLDEMIRFVKKDAERGSGFQKSMKNILGETLYQDYLAKFPK